MLKRMTGAEDGVRDLLVDRPTLLVQRDPKVVILGAGFAGADAAQKLKDAPVRSSCRKETSS